MREKRDTQEPNQEGRRGRVRIDVGRLRSLQILEQIQKYEGGSLILCELDKRYHSRNVRRPQDGASKRMPRLQ